jgi:prepilin-type N-terminal cleavage/methylation domain-containing protein
MFINNKKGFTLIEMMTVVGVIAILSSIAIPNAISWRSNAQLSSTAREIMADLQRTRTEAIKRNRNVEAIFTTGKGAGSTIKDLTSDVILAGTSYSGGIEVTIAEGERFIFNSRGLPVGHDDDNKSIIAIEITNGNRNITVEVTIAGNISIQY